LLAFERSAAIATAVPPDCAILSTVSWIVPASLLAAGSTVRAVTTTVAPLRAKRSAMAAPILGSRQ